MNAPHLNLPSTEKQASQPVNSKAIIYQLLSLGHQPIRTAFVSGMKDNNA